MCWFDLQCDFSSLVLHGSCSVAVYPCINTNGKSIPKEVQDKYCVTNDLVDHIGCYGTIIRAITSIATFATVTCFTARENSFEILSSIERTYVTRTNAHTQKYVIAAASLE